MSHEALDLYKKNFEQENGLCNIETLYFILLATESQIDLFRFSSVT
jgi:hypothetical protein